MSQDYRLSEGGRLNRSKTIRFWFDNKGYEGYPGDTLASALLANGVQLVGRSFKYHRPRGIVSCGSEEPNALVQLENGAHTEPNRRATEIELYDGLTAHSQNRWPSLKHDVGAINAKVARMLPAGFYYKTFMWPGSMWLTYEKFIRKAAGLGKSPTEIDPDCYDKLHAHCDVLIVGGGPAGLQAALHAGRTDARVILIDEKPEFGGSLLGERYDINDAPASEWIRETVSQIKQLPNVTLLPRTTVTGYYDYNFLVANERFSEHLGPKHPGNEPKERLWKIRAKQVVLATGSIERPLVFADNDRPGVMLAGAIRNYINRFGVLPAKRLVILTNNDSAYLTALESQSAGATVEIVDTRPSPESDWVSAAREAGIRIYENSTITGVDYRRGRIQHVDIMQLSPDGIDVRGARTVLDCEVVGVSGGWTPTVHLYSQSRGKLRFLDDKHCFVPGEPSPTCVSMSVGACAAEFSLSGALEDGAEAGRSAAAAAGFEHADAVNVPAVNEQKEADFRAQWIMPTDHPVGRGPKKHFHELHNDATVGDIELAAREGFESVEHLKRYTTTGMGTDQGKTSNMNALSVMSNLRNTTIPAVGTTTFRPPYTPLSFGSVVGHDRRELFLQKRKTAMHPWHARNNAVFEDVGDWKRPFYFPKSGEDMHAAVQRECLVTRTSCGLLDASTLGKIDIQGADASRLLNMVYTNAWSKLAPGKCRYGLMLNEHGMVFDDGVTTCLGQNHYHMTTTTGGAARVMGWLEEWLQTEWPEWDVYCTSVTEQWAVASLNGPNSRKVLEKLCDQPLDDDSFPFMSTQSFEVAGIPARVFRISFTGELSYEINVPARYGLALWEAVMAAGDEFDICPYGTEAMHVLRAEKGFIIVGQDTDGTVTPMDLGMDWIVSKQKEDFLGRRSFSRSDTSREGRKQLVGILTEDPKVVLQEGAHLVSEVKSAPPMNMVGHVTSSYMSPNVGRSIALALVEDGHNKIGSTLSVALMDGSSQRVTITKPTFLE
ncbi:MAG: sarcosine oxidase subunit alpha family protein [Pseudomonadota bacterium]